MDAMRKAMRNAQRKIDSVLDIRPEEPEESEYEDSDSRRESNTDLPVILDESTIVVQEPILPPSSRGVICAEDMQSVISSDIEVLVGGATTPQSTTDPSVDQSEIMNLKLKVKLLEDNLENERKKMVVMKDKYTGLEKKISELEQQRNTIQDEAKRFSKEAFNARQEAIAARKKITPMEKEIKKLKDDVTTRDEQIATHERRLTDNADEMKLSKEEKVKQDLYTKRVTGEIGKLHKMVEKLLNLIIFLRKKYESDNVFNSYEYIISLNEEEFNNEIEFLRKKCKRIEVNDGIDNPEEVGDGPEELLEFEKARKLMEREIENMMLDIVDKERFTDDWREDKKRLEAELIAKDQYYEKKIADLIEAVKFNSNENNDILKEQGDSLMSLQKKLIDREQQFHDVIQWVRTYSLSMKKSMGLLLESVNQEKNDNENALRQMNNDVQYLISRIVEQYDETIAKLKRDERKYSEKIVQTELYDNEPNENKLEQDVEVISKDILSQVKLETNIEISKLINEKEELETSLRRVMFDLKESKKQLNEVLIMHGEKIEEIEELKTDNEDLRKILKEQALSLTAHTVND